jgi:DNA-binding NarL/FixJ family response regulator
MNDAVTLTPFPQTAPVRAADDGGRPRASRSAPVAVRVTVIASDRISGQGLVAYLSSRPEIAVLESARRREAQVAVVVVDKITDKALETMAAATHPADEPLRFVLVGDDVREAHMGRLASLGMVSVLNRRTTDFDQIARAVVNLSEGRPQLPGDAVGWLSQLLRTVQQNVLEPNGLSAGGLTKREVDVLGLLADGLSTSEIAERLNYSERTVKNTIHLLTSRLKLRNRAHAVAFAIRAGAI